MRRSSSVIVARTRMCLRTVAIIRGGNFCGAAWHRPQLAWNRFSPSIRIESLSDACTTATPVAGRFLLRKSPRTPKWPAPAETASPTSCSEQSVSLSPLRRAGAPERNQEAVGQSEAPLVEVAG